MRPRSREGRVANPLLVALFALMTLAVCVACVIGIAISSHLASTPQVKAPPSPLLFGTNMALFTANDQIVNNPGTQRLLKDNGMAIIRIPSRHELPDEVELAALRTVKAIGAAPLMILHGAVDQNALVDDSHLLGLVQSVFGKGPAYIEIGNEEDLAGVDVARYTDGWNQLVPRLKAQAPTYKFIGPVTSTYNPAYIAAFDQRANPRPDFNSWHEYVCNTGNSDTYCMEHISNWNTHVTLTNDAVKRAIGVTLPFMITEWNMDPGYDPRTADPVFIRSWTTKALQTLTANADHGLFAAMQYCATNNTGFSLIDDQNMFTPQGEAFFQSFAIALGRHSPTPARTPTLAMIPGQHGATANSKRQRRPRSAL